MYTERESMEGREIAVPRRLPRVPDAKKYHRVGWERRPQPTIQRCQPPLSE